MVYRSLVYILWYIGYIHGLVCIRLEFRGKCRLCVYIPALIQDCLRRLCCQDFFCCYEVSILIPARKLVAVIRCRFWSGKAFRCNQLDVVLSCGYASSGLCHIMHFCCLLCICYKVCGKRSAHIFAAGLGSRIHLCLAQGCIRSHFGSVYRPVHELVTWVGCCCWALRHSRCRCQVFACTAYGSTCFRVCHVIQGYLIFLRKLRYILRSRIGSICILIQVRFCSFRCQDVFFCYQGFSLVPACEPVARLGFRSGSVDRISCHDLDRITVMVYRSLVFILWYIGHIHRLVCIQLKLRGVGCCRIGSICILIQVRFCSFRCQDVFFCYQGFSLVPACEPVARLGFRSGSVDRISCHDLDRITVMVYRSLVFILWYIGYIHGLCRIQSIIQIQHKTSISNYCSACNCFLSIVIICCLISITWIWFWCCIYSLFCSSCLFFCLCTCYITISIQSIMIYNIIYCTRTPLCIQCCVFVNCKFTVSSIWSSTSIFLRIPSSKCISCSCRNLVTYSNLWTFHVLCSIRHIVPCSLWCIWIIYKIYFCFIQ